MSSATPLATQMVRRAPLTATRLTRYSPVCRVSLTTPLSSSSSSSSASSALPSSSLLLPGWQARVLLSSSASPSAGSFEARQQAVFPVRRTGVNSSGAKVERPVSPHVTIYSQPIPAVSSITNRASGVMLTIGMYGGGLAALAGSCDLPAAIFAFQQSAPALVPVVKAVVAWPLVYHTLAGVRHLVWDYSARGMDLSSVELSSKALIASSVALTLGAAFVTISPPPASKQ